MNTPLQELLETLRSMQIAATAQSLRFESAGLETAALGSEAMEKAYMIAQEKAKQLLPKEKEVIYNAVAYGNRQDFYDGTETIAEQYYTQTFTNQTTENEQGKD